MKRIVIVAVILAVVVTPFVIAPIFSGTTSIEELTTKELVHEIKSRQLFAGDFEALFEVPKLWRQLSKVMAQLSEEERQVLLAQFVQSSIERLDGNETPEHVELFVSIDASVSWSINRMKAFVILPDGTEHPLEYNNTSFETGLNEIGPYMRYGLQIDRSQIDTGEKQDWADSTILLTNEMTLGGNPSWPFKWQAEYTVER